MEIKINKFDYFGRGIGKINDKVFFVNKALPSEVVDIKIIKEKKKYSVADVKEVIEESPERIKPICPFYNKCGGCTLLHATYEEEKKFKISKAIELLGRCDNFYETCNMNYRNKVVLHVKNGKMGLYTESSNDLVDIDYCYLLDEKINNIIKELRSVDLNKVNEIIIKCHLNKTLIHFYGEINISELNNINADNILCNDTILKGDGYLLENINNKIIKVTSGSFFQVNKMGLLNIYNIINGYLDDKEINSVLDLYSGISLWSILLSDRVNNLFSIEINKEACLNAKESLKINDINNIKVINGDVKDYIEKFKDIDLVIIDPPRSGLDKKSRIYLNEINSKYIIYISCDMISLKRDLEELRGKYDIKDISLVDMFKRTYHVECVLLLCRKNVDK